MSSEHRIKRVEHTVKTVIAEIIQQEIKDPNLGFITISDVHISKDLRNAIVFVSVLQQKGKVEDSIDILQGARGIIKKHLRERVVMKYMPELTFKHDTSLDNAFHIEEVLKKIHSENPEQKN